ncbi:Y-family DNA polymerase [Pedobacter psychroterrae]|uniref:Y-family DNA polymerase n=1 Tax=Pedobacter psychroterrae TaxID=2530453 RepID=A0A4R0NJE3_9SPHI|nr:Y-family DNA polymerase [Pedobacter psychroterrae]TCC99937.1 Y-family DNA polymerase [Pedobacter psychroterrae]
MMALIDSNNFYVSAERVFQPELRDKAGCVLSNNDGCAISRSNEAKEQLGIRMGTPFFMMREQHTSGKLWWRSSNYTLYQDMMRRITQIVRDTFPDQEIYSIDECFCDLATFKHHDLEQVAIDLRRKILQYTGVPVCIGIGATKTLAKIANKLAKKQHKTTGVYYMGTAAQIEQALKDTEVDDVWGIGPRYGIKLIKAGVYTAYDFVNLPEDYVLKLMTIQGWRTYRELKGERCIPMEFERPLKEGISTARSFNCMITELAPLEEALASYVANASQKLREQRSVCARFMVYAQTSQFVAEKDRYTKDIVVKLTRPTSDTGTLITEALKALRRIYVKGYRYQKVGVELRDLRPQSQVQSDLFGKVTVEKQDKLQLAMAAVDHINKVQGRNTIVHGTMGFDKKWSMRQEFLSRRYTTRIEDVIVVKAI